MKRQEHKKARLVALSTNGTVVTVVELRSYGFAPIAGTVAASRDPNELRIDDDVIAFSYFDRVCGEYGTVNKMVPFTCETNRSGIFFVSARKLGDEEVVGRDGAIYNFRPGIDTIVTTRKLVICQLTDGTQRVVSAEAVENGNPGKKMTEKLVRSTVFYQVVLRLCGNDPVPLTPRTYIRGAAQGCNSVFDATGQIPDSVTVAGRIEGRPDSGITGFICTHHGDVRTYWAVYADDVVQDTVQNFWLVSSFAPFVAPPIEAAPTPAEAPAEPDSGILTDETPQPNEVAVEDEGGVGSSRSALAS